MCCLSYCLISLRFMGEFKNVPGKQIQNRGNADGFHGDSISGEEKIIDSRASAFQLVQLQAAADESGKNDKIAHLQIRANQYTSSSGVTQLQSKIDSQASRERTVQLKQLNNHTPKGLQSGMESISGISLEDVKVQHNTEQKQGSETPAIQRVVQKVDTLKASDAQTTAAKDLPVDKAAAKAAITPDSIKDPTKHPMYSTFQARINAVFSQYPAPDGYDVPLITRNIWTQICAGIDDSNAKFDRTTGNDTYSDLGKGYVNMESPGYKKALTEFDSVMNLLKSVNTTSFVKANSFGFWSKPEGREFAEKMTDLTLETSGIGSLFDGMPSLNAHQNGWDVQLWGSLSQAFGQAVSKEMNKKGKEVHVCAGGGTDKTNIFAMVESKALEKGASNIGKTLEEAVTFHSVAAKSKSKREVDSSVKEGSMGLPGTWYSGHSWDDSLRIGKEKFDALPE